MAAFKEFLGGFYSSAAKQLDAEVCENWYPEKVEVAGAKSTQIARSKPGLATFAALAAGVTGVRAECALNGRGFAIGKLGAANVLYEVLASGLSISYGNLPGDRRPQMEASQTQILILAGGLGYIFDLRANTLMRIVDPNFPIGATKARFLDGYFIVLEPNSQTFAICGLNDGMTWDGLDFGDVEGEPGNIVTMVVDHRQIWFLGNNHGEIYYDSGTATFPLTRLDGAFMEQGSCAIDGAFKCDNTLFWLGGNRDGSGIFWRANGYTPQRVSTHPIEARVASFGDLSDVSGYPYQEQGHTFARWDFPSAHGGRGATLLYDVASGFWHERYFWNASLGLRMGDLARCHMYVFDKHLVGDWRSGTIYEQSMQYTSDAGAQIRRVRAAPDLANGGKRTVYGELRLQTEVGVGAASWTPVPVPTNGIGALLIVPTIPTFYQINWEDQFGGGDESYGNGYTEIYFDAVGGATIKYLGKSGGIYRNNYGAGGAHLVGEEMGVTGPVTLASGLVAGQELIIQEFANGDNNPAHAYVTGPASRNPDDFAHARIGNPYYTAAVAAVPDHDPRDDVPANSNGGIPDGGAPIGDATDPQIVLQISNDGGRTWGAERPESLGKLGDYTALVRWRRNGNSKNRAYRVICSEDVAVALIGCDMDTSRA